MNLKKIISIVMSLTLVASAIPVSSVSATTISYADTYAQDDAELLDLYRKYYEDETIIEVNCTGTEDYGDSYYDFVKKPQDYGRIAFSADSEVELNLTELTDSTGYSGDMFSLSSYFSEDSKTQTLKITFSSQEHELNYNIAYEFNKILKEKYNVASSFVCLDAEPFSRTQRVMWNVLSKRDEFGHSVSPDEELTKKQIENIRNEITANNFAASIDDEGKITFNSSASETEKFRFALWLKEEYGFSVSTMTNGMADDITYNTTEIMHYTELSGDVNNDIVNPLYKRTQK